MNHCRRRAGTGRRAQANPEATMPPLTPTTSPSTCATYRHQCQKYEHNVNPPTERGSGRPSNCVTKRVCDQVATYLRIWRQQATSRLRWSTSITWLPHAWGCLRCSTPHVHTLLLICQTNGVSLFKQVKRER